MPAVKKPPPPSQRTTSLTKKERRLLETHYFDPQSPSSFGGVKRLAQSAQIHPLKVRKWLKQQWTYTLHQPVKKSFPTRKYMARGLHHQWQADLVEMQHFSHANAGHRYMLCVIDIFSRYAFARPLKSKTGPDVADALESIFKESGITPRLLQTDQGLEFYNRHVRQVLNQYNVELFSVYTDKKAAIVERFNRTLKSRMYRAFTHQGNYRWLEMLPKLIESYNHSYHRSIKTMPANVNKMNEVDLWNSQYSDLTPGVASKSKLKVGDRVRLIKEKGVFAKGYLQNWTDEEFIIHKVNSKYKPIMYTLVDLEGEEIHGGFYTEELQKVENATHLYRIERIIRTRPRGTHQKEALVKWKGYTKPTWIDVNHIQNIVHTK